MEYFAMKYDDNLAALVDQVKQASANLDANDTRINKLIGQLEKSINELYLKHQRPNSSWNTTDDEVTERKSAVELCRIRRNLTIPKTTTAAPSRRRCRVISCIVDPTDIAGLVGQATTSAESVKFLIDNVRMQIANWACEVACFSNNPAPDLTEGLGTMEVRSESLRFVVCVSNELLEDASFPIESWIMRKASAGFRHAISAAILARWCGSPTWDAQPECGNSGR